MSREAAHGPAGHRLLPHTADVIVEAWAPRRNVCMEHAVLGLIGSFAAARPGAPSTAHTFDVPAGDDSELLIAVLEEAIYLVDAQGLVTIGATIDDGGDAGLHVIFDVVGLEDVETIGSVPKGVARHALRITAEAGRWTCRVVVDV